MYLRDIPLRIIVHKVCARISRLMINVINQGHQKYCQKNVTIESYRDLTRITMYHH